MDRGVEGSHIGIITPYNAQANIIREAVSASLEINTIDKYQVIVLPFYSYWSKLRWLPFFVNLAEAKQLHISSNVFREICRTLNHDIASKR